MALSIKVGALPRLDRRGKASGNGENVYGAVYGLKEAILSAADKLAALKIKTICPQHGSIIRNNIPEWINALKKMEYGRALNEQIKWWR